MKVRIARPGAPERKLTMNFLKKLLALCAVLALICASALAEEPQAPAQVLITVNDHEITAENADFIAYLLYYYGYTENYPDYDAALDYLTQQAVIENHLRSAGYTDFDEDTMTALRNEAQAEWDSMLDEYVEENLAEDTEENRATLRQQAAAYYEAQDYGLEKILDQLVLHAAQDVLETELSGGYTPTDEEIDQVFNT